MMTILTEVNFVGPVLLDRGATTNLWNPLSMGHVSLFLAEVAGEKVILVCNAAGDETLRAIPYHMVRDYKAKSKFYGLPKTLEPRKPVIEAQRAKATSKNSEEAPKRVKIS